MLNDFDFDSNGDIYAVGTFSHTEEFGETIVTSLASHDGYIVKISEEGEWGAVKTFSSSYDFSLEKVSVNNVGNIAIAGHFADSTMECDDLSISNEDDNGGSMDIFVAVLDSNFNCLWLNSIGGENNDVVKELIFNDDGTVTVKDDGRGIPVDIHKGEKKSEKIQSSKPTIVNFGLTHSPEVCPTTLYQISSWINEIKLSKEQIQVLFISLDPKRDTVQKLEEYLSNFDETFKGLTGDENEILKLANSWGIYRKIVSTDDDYTIDHTSTIFLINQNFSLKGTIAYREHSDVAIAKIKNLIKENQ